MRMYRFPGRYTHTHVVVYTSIMKRIATTKKERKRYNSHNFIKIKVAITGSTWT